MPIVPFFPSRDPDDDGDAPDPDDVAERIINGGGGPTPTSVPA